MVLTSFHKKPNTTPILPNERFRTFCLQSLSSNVGSLVSSDSCSGWKPNYLGKTSKFYCPCISTLQLRCFSLESSEFATIENCFLTNSLKIPKLVKLQSTYSLMLSFVRIDSCLWIYLRRFISVYTLQIFLFCQSWNYEVQITELPQMLTRKECENVWPCWISPTHNPLKRIRIRRPSV